METTPEKQTQLPGRLNSIPENRNLESRNYMAKKTAIEKATPADIVKSEDEAMNELAAFFDAPDGVDGLEDFEGDDVKISTLLWNMRGKDKHGNTMTKDVFFDTISEETRKEVDLVLLTVKKTRRWDEFNNTTDKTEVHCESRDRITGTLSDGTTRPCHGCPDYGWFKDEKGENKRKCGDVQNAVGVTLDTMKPITIRFKKTGLKPYRAHVSTHHKGARLHVAKDGTRSRRNVPLFAYAVRMSLKMSDNGMYATPVMDLIEQGKGADGEPTYLLPTNDVMAYGSLAKEWTDMMAMALDAADKQAEVYDAGGDSGGGSVVDANEFADD